jgi:hypothetical protein
MFFRCRVAVLCAKVNSLSQHFKKIVLAKKIIAEACVLLQDIEHLMEVL